MATLNAATDAELPVEEVAERLGLPVGMLVRRIEAGDITARRDASDGEPRYHLRLSDLGITAEEAAIFQSNQHAARNGSGQQPETIDLAGRASRAGRGAADEETDAVLSDVALDGPADPGPDIDAETLVEDVVPPPGSIREPRMSVVGHPDGPRAELATMTIDPRELVAGLLDRWERTLEQRIYAEQRQRFEAELTNRMHQVKELRSELQAVRAEHAAAQAEKDLVLAAKERELADQERALADERSRPKRRGWFTRF